MLPQRPYVAERQTLQIRDYLAQWTQPLVPGSFFTVADIIFEPRKNRITVPILCDPEHAPHIVRTLQGKARSLESQLYRVIRRRRKMRLVFIPAARPSDSPPLGNLL